MKRTTDRSPIVQKKFEPISWRRQGCCHIDPALDSIMKLAVYRYAPIAEALAFCDGRLSFVSPQCWPDKYESHVVDKIFSKNSRFKNSTPFVKCFSVAHSSEAMWRTYSGPGGLVRVGVGLGDLIAALDTAAGPLGHKIYIGRVRYLIAEKVRNAVVQVSNDSSAAKRSDLMSALLLKRSAFLYENEVRVAIIPTKCKDAVLNISNVSVKKIRRILLDPYLPKWQTDELEKVFRKLVPKGTRVEQSEFDRHPSEFDDEI